MRTNYRAALLWAVHGFHGCNGSAVLRAYTSGNARNILQALGGLASAW